MRFLAITAAFLFSATAAQARAQVEVEPAEVDPAEVDRTTSPDDGSVGDAPAVRADDPATPPAAESPPPPLLTPASETSGGSGSTGTGSSRAGSTTATGASAPAGSTVRTYDGRPAPAPVVVEEEPEEEGDGRDVDFIWIEFEGGVANVNLVAFSGSADFSMSGTGGTTFSEIESTGGYGALGVGFRVYWLAIGARAAVAAHSGFELGMVGGEATLRFPIPVVEPYIRAGVGYAWQGSASYSVLETPTSPPVVHNTTVYGWAFNSAVGIDIYLANWITIGGGLGFDLLNMSRQTDPTMACMGVTDICPGRAGDAVGYNLRGYGQIGLRF